ncbi:3-isopropylmalate/(R)-2-methylmalate dehydratase small subunit [Marchantia polymorpha subsp. ruderalis]|uniref:3-isopropylmalate dehydratase n=2 Tax=Marchantia polymorpha TaxID=3197 RepID=A0A176WCB1_MARPO|nr:hypothetical protein AXG93_773s1140 [Marchantia polymorpha subsp. ruderalis]PTQ50046.1 hypothetical protein MARPO_0001s0104 [Marchantia polymorpha]BBM98969.1 hypothetical protein Mp_1g17640 [Marchantia polymorpha subsp. ruderalis]|eukprot:PTQ50046.1 hypothetical protein MARPO_0001s0104 [Marchantia polymorpha]
MAATSAMTNINVASVAASTCVLRRDTEISFARLGNVQAPSRSATCGTFGTRLTVHVANKKCCQGKAPGIRAAAQVEGRSDAEKASGRIIHGKCFVVGDNIDTDQIIPAEYLTLVPSKPDEYEKLGSYAMIGLPAEWGRFIEEGQMKTQYAVMIGGDNFGCGSSREHAPVALGAAGVKAVVAESYARIFFRNSVATGELYPVESEKRIFQENSTGDMVTVDLEHDLLINHTNGKTFALKPIGDAGPVIDAGGIFAYARETGMIAAK